MHHHDFEACASGALKHDGCFKEVSDTGKFKTTRQGSFIPLCSQDKPGIGTPNGNMDHVGCCVDCVK
jgi:hypothetical protein